MIEPLLAVAILALAATLGVLAGRLFDLLRQLLVAQRETNRLLAAQTSLAVQIDGGAILDKVRRPTFGPGQRWT